LAAAALAAAACLAFPAGNGKRHYGAAQCCLPFSVSFLSMLFLFFE
jgi:hypothetical protein